jgi:hypothetical protein
MTHWQARPCAPTPPPGLKGLGYSLQRLLGSSAPVQIRLGVFNHEPVVLDVPSEPAWPSIAASLHQPHLRQHWIQHLRRARYERLLRLIPAAIEVLDSTPAELPPGALLHTVDLPSWQHLPELHQRPYRWEGWHPQRGRWTLSDQDQAVAPGTVIRRLPRALPDCEWRLDYATDSEAKIALSLASLLS